VLNDLIGPSPIKGHDQVSPLVEEHRHIRVGALEQPALLGDQIQRFGVGAARLARHLSNTDAGCLDLAPIDRLGGICSVAKVLMSEFEPMQATLLEELGGAIRCIGPRATYCELHFCPLAPDHPLSGCVDLSARFAHFAELSSLGT
jgi:hypothetical protein